MEGFFKRNQKKILAIFSAGLMVAFAIPSMKSAGGRGDIVYGTVRGGKVRVRDIDEARSQLEVLRKIYYTDSDPRNPQNTRVSTVLERRLGGAAAREIEGRPELFYLLWREADDAGVTVPDDEVKSVLVNAQGATGGDEDTEQRRQEAVRALLMITNNADRAAKVLHVSVPERNLRLAGQQDVAVNVVEFKAADYASKVPEWNEKERTQKAHEQYEKFKNNEPTTRPGNDFRFGYKVANRVRVQAIGLPRDKV